MNEFGRFSLRGMGGNRTHGEAFAEPCLTTWLPRRNLKFIKQSYIVSLIKQKIKTPPEIFYYFKSGFVFRLSRILFFGYIEKSLQSQALAVSFLRISMKGNIPNIEHPQNVAARRTMGLFDILFSSMVHANAVPSCEKPNIADAVPLLFDSENGFNAKFVVSGKSIPKKNIVANRKSAKRIRLFKKYADAKNAAEHSIIEANASFR